MSAPVSHDPLVVNTKDGAVWRRRAVTEDGRGLYAADGTCACPEFLLVPLSELAVHGIVGSADVLPVPVGPVLRSELDQARDDVVGACLARWEEEQDNERLRWALASAKRGRARLRAQVAALLEERHSTNESLDDAVQELRARQSCPCPPADQPGPHQLGCPQAEVPSSPERPVDGLAATFMPVAAYREDPHDSPLHHDYRIPHDLPLGCGLTDAQVERLGNPFLDGGA